MLKDLLRLIVAFLVAPCLYSAAQTGAATNADALQTLHFLEGSWTAHGTGQGATSDGTYTFRRELNGHVLARHARLASCKAPSDFDCEHNDLLYVYVDGPGQPLKALFLDNEGHALHYTVTTPEPTTAVFLSEPISGSPQFRLMYTLKAGTMVGSFALQTPGSTEWRPYLTWTGNATSGSAAPKP